MTVVMCKRCAGAIEYDADLWDDAPDTHDDVGKECPTDYRE